jgi:polyphosphate glucokinase
MKILGIDVGGSGIKGALVDTETGKFTSERLRIDTPEGLRQVMCWHHSPDGDRI